MSPLPPLPRPTDPGARWAAFDEGVRRETRWAGRRRVRMATPAKVVTAASHASGHVREKAEALLARWGGDTAIPALALRCTDHVEQVREPARAALDARLAADPAAVLLAGPVAVALSRRIGGEWLLARVEERLAALPDDGMRMALRSPDRPFRASAVRIAIAGGRLSRPALIALASRDPDTRIRSLCATAALADASPTEAREALTARSAHLRALAVAALARAGETHDLVAALADPAGRVRLAARRGMVAAGLDPAAHYRAAVAGDVPPHPALIAGLGETGGPADAAAVGRWLAHPEARGRAQAVRALHVLHAVEPERLVPLLEDPAPSVTRQVTRALRPFARDLDAGRLRALLEPANPPHTRRAAYRLLLAGDELLRLRTTLELVGDPLLGPAAREDLRAGVRSRLARSYLRPDPTQAARLDALVSRASPVLGRRAEAELRFALGLPR